MADKLTWSPDSRVCKNTWMLLVSIDELEETFKKSGTRTVKKLKTWNPDPDVSSELRSAWAGGIAAELAGLFLVKAGGTYKKGKDFGTAVGDMHDILVVGDKTMLDLATAADGNYQFPA